MTTRFRPHVLAVALACCAGAHAAAAQPAPANPAPVASSDLHVLRLTNSGKMGITAIYAAPADSIDMSDDLLGRQTANAGRTVTLKIKDPKSVCAFDLQFLMNNGDTVTRKRVNLCQTVDYVFTP